MCCLREVRWRGQGARMLEMMGRRYRLWWSGKVDGVGGVGVVVKEELCEEVVEVRRLRSDDCCCCCFLEDVVRLTCEYAAQSGRSLEEKLSFYDELKCEWDVI